MWLPTAQLFLAKLWYLSQIKPTIFDDQEQAAILEPQGSRTPV